MVSIYHMLATVSLHTSFHVILFGYSLDEMFYFCLEHGLKKSSWLPHTHLEVRNLFHVVGGRCLYKDGNNHVIIIVIIDVVVVNGTTDSPK